MSARSWKMLVLRSWLPVILALLASPALGQAILVVTDQNQVVRLPRPVSPWSPHHGWPHPRPQPLPPAATYKISEISVQARIAQQTARVQVAQTFVNTGSRTIEASLVFPLPYEGAIEQMTLLVDGKEYAARLMKADEARRIYEETVRKSRDPALLEWVGTGMFRSSVFPIPPGEKRQVSLRYVQLLRQSDGLMDFLFPLGTAKYTAEHVERINLRVSIESDDEIKNIYSPTHPVQVSRRGSNNAVIEYNARNDLPQADFRLLFNMGRGTLSSRLLSYRPKENEDGYFLVLASPQVPRKTEESQPKTVVIAIDRSGSMSGKKIDQVRGALKFILNRLDQRDLFNLVAYDAHVECFRPELERCTPDNRQAALAFADGLYAGGSTNIGGALEAALGGLTDRTQPAYVIFLTDGLPTTGETNESKIIALARRANKIRARVFAFGVGYDVNSRLLDRLSVENFGQAEYVRPEEDIEDRVSRLYQRIQAPVLTEVKLEIAVDRPDPHGSIVNRVYPKQAFDLFAGQQWVAVGRYKSPGEAKVTLTGKLGQKNETFHFPGKLVQKSRDESQAFIARLWAMRRVAEVLEEIDLSGKNDELVAELVELSTRHGILTPYTSFLADESSMASGVVQQRRVTSERLSALSDTQGQGAFEQRAMRGSLRNATPAPAAPAALSFGGAGMGGGMGIGGPRDMGGGMGMAGRVPAKSSAVPYGWASQAEKEQAAAAQNVRQIESRTFYRRGGRWVDSTVTPAQEKSPQTLRQFSDEYFKLVRQHGRNVSPYLVFDEPVLLAIDGQAYLIEP